MGKKDKGKSPKMHAKGLIMMKGSGKGGQKPTINLAVMTKGKIKAVVPKGGFGPKKVRATPGKCSAQWADKNWMVNPMLKWTFIFPKMKRTKVETSSKK